MYGAPHNTGQVRACGTPNLTPSTPGSLAMILEGEENTLYNPLLGGTGN